jgi:integrase
MRHYQYRPWYRASKDKWFVEIRGRQVPLGRHPEGAPAPRKGKNGWNPPPEIMAEFHKLMAADPTTVPKADEIRVCQVCDLFLQWSEKHHKPDTFRWYGYFLQSFCDAAGTLKAAELRPFNVTRWIDGHDDWHGGRRNAVVCVKRAFNWAAAEGIIADNPIKSVKKPQQKARSRTVTAAEKREILDAIKDRQFREFVFAMQETGARPGELRRVTAANVNLELGVIALGEHKTAHRTGRPRIIYLTRAMIDLLRRLTSLHPEGPLFRGPLSKRGFSSNGVRCRFRHLRKKLPHLKGVIATAYRHSFATDALEKGVGIAQVAELLGHADTKMVSRHYSQLSQRVQHLREMAQKATDSKAG